MRTRRSSVPFAWLLAASAACASGASTPPVSARTSVPVPARDSASRGGAASGRDSAARAETLVVIDRHEIRLRDNSAHMALLEFNARMHEKFMARFSEKTCPPESAYGPDTRHRRGTAVASRTDSLRGWIRICEYGDRKLPALWLSYADSMDIALVGHHEVLLQMENLDVVIFGHQSRVRSGTWRRLEVRREIVRRNGAGFEAVDGMLRRESTGDFVELPDRTRVRIPSIPQELAGANGMRVYIAGPLSDPLQAGVIRTREISPAPR